MTDLRKNENLMNTLLVYENEEKKLAMENPSMMSEQELMAWTLKESKKHNYKNVPFLIFSKDKTPLNKVYEVNE